MLGEGDGCVWYEEGKRMVLDTDEDHRQFN